MIGCEELSRRGPKAQHLKRLGINCAGRSFKMTAGAVVFYKTFAECFPMHLPALTGLSAVAGYADVVFLDSIDRRHCGSLLTTAADRQLVFKACILVLPNAACELSLPG